MRKLHRYTPVLLALASFALSASAVEGNEFRRRLVEDAADGALDHFSLCQAALIAGSDLNAEQFETASARLNGIFASAAVAAGQASPGQQPAALFRFMHREVLTGEYRSGQNNLNRLIEKGDYNCVTATILFQAICRATGAPPTQAVAAPAHVLCRFKGNALGDVETTCPTWFDRQGRSHVPRAGRPINDVQLVAKIFYNRGVYLLEHERFAEAVEQLEISLMLDGEDRTAQANRLAALNNWALAESRNQRFVQAAALLKRGSAIDPNYGPFLSNDLHVHQKWVRLLCEQRNEAEAVRLLLDRAEDRPKEPLFRDGPLAIYRHWLRRLAADQDGPNRLADIVATRRLLPNLEEVSREEQRLLGPALAKQVAQFAKSRGAEAASTADRQLAP